MLKWWNYANDTGVGGDTLTVVKYKAAWTVIFKLRSTFWKTPQESPEGVTNPHNVLHCGVTQHKGNSKVNKAQPEQLHGTNKATPN